MNTLIFPPQFVMRSIALCHAWLAAEDPIEARIFALLASKSQPDDQENHIYKLHISEITNRQDYNASDFKEVEQSMDQAMGRLYKRYRAGGALILQQINFTIDDATYHFHLNTDLMRYQ